MIKVKSAELVVSPLWSQLLGRLRQENCLNIGGRCCSELRLHPCTPAWATERDYISIIIKKTHLLFLSLCLSYFYAVMYL